jgi:hypothetical protein
MPLSRNEVWVLEGDLVGGGLTPLQVGCLQEQMASLLRRHNDFRVRRDPGRYIEIPTPHVAVSATTECHAALPAPLKMGRDRLFVKRVPRVVDFQKLGLMCVVLLIRICMRARIWRWRKMRLRGERFNRPNLERWSRSRKWEGSITGTNDERLKEAFPSDDSESPSFCPQTSRLDKRTLRQIPPWSARER